MFKTKEKGEDIFAENETKLQEILKALRFKMFANQLKMYHFYYYTRLGTINIRPKKSS